LKVLYLQRTKALWGAKAETDPTRTAARAENFMVRRRGDRKKRV
jgi:hypothetical protein